MKKSKLEQELYIKQLQDLIVEQSETIRKLKLALRPQQMPEIEYMPQNIIRKKKRTRKK